MASLKMDFAVLEARVSKSAPGVQLDISGGQTPFGSIKVAIDEEGRREILVPLEPGASLRPDNRSAGVQTARSVLVLEGIRREFLSIRCLKTHLHDVFDLIASEMVVAIVDQPARPDLTASMILERWRELLGKPPRDLPSREVLIGLWGELWHVRSVVERCGVALDFWTGPDATAKDLQGVGVAVEVKTSTVRTSWRVHINSEYQLDAGDGRLFLSVLRVDEAGAGGLSIADFFDQLIATGVDYHDLVSKLSESGLDIAHLAEVRKLRFEVLEHRIWRVVDDFPRITPSWFGSAWSPHIAGVRYEIDLTGYPSNMDDHDWGAVIKEFGK